MPSNIRSLFKRRKPKGSNAEQPKSLVKPKPDPPTPPTSPLDHDSIISDASESQSESRCDHINSVDIGQQSTRSSEGEPRVKFTESVKKPDPLEASEVAPKSTLKSSFIKRFGKGSNVKSDAGVPIITAFDGADHFSPSLVTSENSAEAGYRKKKVPRPKVRPDAKTSAFAGPVRYDWMDIESAAAIKVQAAYRRFSTLKQLDDQGLSTAAIRNRRRKLKAKNRMIKSEDVPFPFSLCGVGFIFGDGTLEDERVVTEMERKKMQKLREEAERREAEKRKFRMRKKESQHLEEGIEVVESFESQSDADESDESDLSVGEEE